MSEAKPKKPRRVHCCEPAYCVGDCGRTRPSCAVAHRSYYTCRECQKRWNALLKSTATCLTVPEGEPF